MEGKIWKLLGNTEKFSNVIRPEEVIEHFDLDLTFQGEAKIFQNDPIVKINILTVSEINKSIGQITQIF